MNEVKAFSGSTGRVAADIDNFQRLLRGTIVDVNMVAAGVSASSSMYSEGDVLVVITYNKSIQDS